LIAVAETISEETGVTIEEASQTAGEIVTGAIEAATEGNEG
jgi:hypothetical protein